MILIIMIYLVLFLFQIITNTITIDIKDRGKHTCVYACACVVRVNQPYVVRYFEGLCICILNAHGIYINVR